MGDVIIEQLLIQLKNIQSKIDLAAGAATAFELKLRIIAELEPAVRAKIRPSKTFYDVELKELVDAATEVFKNDITLQEIKLLKDLRIPRNKAVHGSLIELMLEMNIQPIGREIDPITNQRKPLSKADLIEGAKSIETNNVLENFARQVFNATSVLDKILRSL